MTELDEVAAAMLPGYLARREQRWKEGRLAGSPASYAMDMLCKDESYNVIDGVAASLTRMVNDHDAAANKPAAKG